jgi:hypothetical protein
MEAIIINIDETVCALRAVPDQRLNLRATFREGILRFNTCLLNACHRTVVTVSATVVTWQKIYLEP